MSALSPREVDALRLLTTGATHLGISRELGATVGATRMVLHDLYVKLGARNAAQAVAIGFRTGLLR